MSIPLTWEEKLEAIKALSRDVSLEMRSPGDWFLHTSGLGISDGTLIKMGVGLHGNSPADVVEHAWEELISIDGFDKAIRIERSPEYIPYFYIWNGFMWKDITKSFSLYKGGTVSAY